jgi:hypothetical protein
VRPVIHRSRGANRNICCESLYLAQVGATCHTQKARQRGDKSPTVEGLIVRPWHFTQGRTERALERGGSSERAEDARPEPGLSRHRRAWGESRKRVPGAVLDVSVPPQHTGGRQVVGRPSGRAVDARVH